MNVLSDENDQPIENTNANDTEDLDSLLKNYQNTYTSVPDSQPSNTPTGNTQGVVITNPTDDGKHWEGNPDYFQTGKKAGQRRNKKQEPELSGALITGAMLLLLIDLLVPLIVVVVHNLVSKNKIDYTDLKMEPSQKSELTPIFDAAAKRLSMRGNPIWLALIGMTGVYGIKYIAARQIAENEAELKKQENEAKENRDKNQS